MQVIVTVRTHMLKQIFAVLISALSVSAYAETVAKIKMDDEHLQMQRLDGKSPQMYVINPSDSLELNSSGYELAAPDALKGKQANSIQLVLGKSEQYSSSWKAGMTKHLLNGATLKPNPGSAPYKGIAKGKDGVIAVGYMDSGNFSVFWVGMFKVQ